MELVPVNSKPGSNQQVVEVKDAKNGLSNRVPLRHKNERPRSCRLQLTASPCVKKVSLLLELLSNNISETIQAKKDSRQMQTSVDLQVVGVGQNIDVANIESEARTVADDVVGIVSRIEEEIAETENHLQNQRETAGNFKSGLHSLRRQQLQTLHTAVNNEHSSCSFDIQELDWHVNHEKRQVAGLEKRYNIAVKLNIDLKKDIDFFERTKPELTVKAENEETMMTEILNEQNNAKGVLKQRTGILKDTTEKHVVAINKITEERTFIQNDLNKVKKKLADVKQSITDARSEYDYMVEKKSRSEKAIQKNILDKQLFDLKADNAKGAIKLQNDVNAKISSQLDGLMEESRETENQLMSFRADFQTQKSTWDDIIASLQESLNAMEERYRVLHQEANDLEALVDDKQRDFDALKKRKNELDTNVRRMEKDIVKYEDQMILMLGEIGKLESLVHGAETELRKIVAQNAEAERAKRATIENLKQQVNMLKQEIQNLESRFETDTEELHAIRTHTEWKKDQMEKIIAEQDATIADRTRKVEKLKHKNSDRLATEASLEQQLLDLRENRALTEQRLNSEIEATRAKIEELTATKGNQAAELYAMRLDSERLHKLIKDLDSQTATMNAAGLRYDARVAELEGIFSEASRQMSWRKEIEDELQTRLNRNQANQRQDAEKHDADVIYRRNVLKAVTECFGANLYYNAYLKGKYRMRQNELNETRNTVSNSQIVQSMLKLRAADSTLTTHFLQMFEAANELSSKVRREFCAVHQRNLDCQCCFNVKDVKDISIAMGDDAKEDGKQILEIAKAQTKIRHDTQYSDFNTVPFDVATDLVSKPAIDLVKKKQG